MKLIAPAALALMSLSACGEPAPEPAPVPAAAPEPPRAHELTVWRQPQGEQATLEHTDYPSKEACEAAVAKVRAEGSAARREEAKVNPLAAMRVKAGCTPK